MKTYQWGLGLALTVMLAQAARHIARIPGFSILGVMVTAIVLGILLRSIFAERITGLSPGFSFSAKYLLRTGIILMGVRLNLHDIWQAGWETILLDIGVIAFTIPVVQLLGQRSGLAQKLTALLAVGTGVCGAAAIAAVAPLIKAKNEEVAISVATISLLGTMFTVIYTLLLPLIGLPPVEFGRFAGATLHELAHVIAATAPFGQAANDAAILVKLGRVALLAPVAILVARQFRGNTAEQAPSSAITMPWFIFGFIIMAGINTLGVFSPEQTRWITAVSLFFLTTSMAGIGLNISLVSLRRTGVKPVLVCLAGSCLLAVFGRWLLWALS